MKEYKRTKLHAFVVINLYVFGGLVILLLGADLILRFESHSRDELILGFIGIWIGIIMLFAANMIEREYPRKEKERKMFPRKKQIRLR